MQRDRAAKTYHQDQIRHASPVDLIVMLYDKTLFHLRRAIAALDAGQLQEKGETLCRAAEIIGELRAVLDRERGGEIATNLDNLYGYMLEQLTIAHYDNDAEKLRLVVRLMEELREGWRGVAKAQQAQPVHP